MFIRCVTFAFLVLFAVSEGYAQDKSVGAGEVLAWKFKEGLALNAAVTQTMSQSMDVNGQKSDVNQSTEMNMSWKVLSVDPKGNASVESVLTRAVMKMNSPQTGEFTIDTDNESDPEGLAKQLGGILRPMVNAKCTQKMASTGEISDVVIPEEVLKSLRGNPLLPPGSENMMTDTITKASPAFPVEAIQAGDSWVQEASTPNPIGEMKIVSTYTYRGPQKNEEGKTLHKIDVDMKLDFKAQGVELKITDQATEGSIYFDNEAGRIDNSNVSQSFTMEIAQGPVKLKQVITQDTAMKFTEVK